jgi:hypothetical protein
MPSPIDFEPDEFVAATLREGGRPDLGEADLLAADEHAETGP